MMEMEERYLPTQFEVGEVKEMDEWEFHCFSRQCWTQYEALIKGDVECSQTGPISRQRKNDIRKLNRLFEAINKEADKRWQKKQKERAEFELKNQQQQQQQQHQQKQKLPRGVKRGVKK